MAEADGKMKDLSISQTKKSKKDGNPKMAAKKPQQQKKKIEGAALIGIDVAKEADLGEWYQQVITKGQMISYYDVAGCYILEPSSYAIWESIKAWFDAKIKTLKVRNAYFPIFISADNLEREKEHVEGFAAEVAWVTKGGKSDLEKPVAVGSIAHVSKLQVNPRPGAPNIRDRHVSLQHLVTLILALTYLGIHISLVRSRVIGVSCHGLLGGCQFP